MRWRALMLVFVLTAMLGGALGYGCGQALDEAITARIVRTIRWQLQQPW